MFSKNSIIIGITSLLFFLGCSSITTSAKHSKKVFQNKDRKYSKKIDTLFYEDSLILYGLRAEELHDYNVASEFFYKLYLKYYKKEYFYRSLEDDLDAKNYKNILKKTKSFDANDLVVQRARIIAYLGVDKLDLAKNSALLLVEKTDSNDDNLLLANVYMRMNAPKKSLDVLEKVYQRNYNNVIIDKIAVLLYTKLNRKKEAIECLEEHRKIHGNSIGVLLRLAFFYSDQKNLDDLLNTYLALYKLHQEPEIAAKIVQIYEYKKEYLDLEDFLKMYHVDDKRLLELYMTTKNFKEAYKLADKIYKENNNIDYLAQSALYQYEVYKKTGNKIFLKEVISKFEKYLQEKDLPVYNNYLGYLLIDHDIDIQKGIIYVQKALVKEPHSAFILDSLAWGYYKEGKCKEALKIMKKILQEDKMLKNKEVLEHFNVIQKCIEQGEKK